MKGGSELKYKEIGIDAILIEWPEEVRESTLKEILSLQSRIEKDFNDEVLEIVPAYNSLTVFLREEFQAQDFLDDIRKLSTNVKSGQTSPTQWQLPVCYDQEFGPDFKVALEHTGLGKDEFIDRHSSVKYLVHFIGFLPGFLYLGGMDPKLSMPRKSNPRKSVPKGAVGIAGNQTGIYPQSSPGGWNLIGNCPIQLFDAHENPPCFAKAGDRLSFKPVSIAEFEKLRKNPPAWDELKKTDHG